MEPLTKQHWRIRQECDGVLAHMLLYNSQWDSMCLSSTHTHTNEFNQDDETLLSGTMLNLVALLEQNHEFFLFQNFTSLLLKSIGWYTPRIPCMSCFPLDCHSKDTGLKEILYWARHHLLQDFVLICFRNSGTTLEKEMLMMFFGTIKGGSICHGLVNVISIIIIIIIINSNSNNRKNRHMDGWCLLQGMKFGGCDNVVFFRCHKQNMPILTFPWFGTKKGKIFGPLKANDSVMKEQTWVCSKNQTEREQETSKGGRHGEATRVCPYPWKYTFTTHHI